MLPLRNVLRRKARSFFAVLQIAVAIAAFVSIVGVTQGLRAQFYRISQVFAFDLIVQAALMPGLRIGAIVETRGKSALPAIAMAGHSADMAVAAKTTGAIDRTIESGRIAITDDLEAMADAVREHHGSAALRREVTIESRKLFARYSTATRRQYDELAAMISSH